MCVGGRMDKGVEILLVKLWGAIVCPASFGNLMPLHVVCAVGCVARCVVCVSWRSGVLRRAWIACVVTSLCCKCVR